MDISAAFLCRSLLFIVLVFYLTVILFSANRYTCPSSSPDVIVSPFLKSDGRSAAINDDSAIHVNIDHRRPQPDPPPEPKIQTIEEESIKENEVKVKPESKTETESAAEPELEPTTLKHVVFGIVGSEKAWHQRRAYIESWWRPNVTRGYLFLDKPPTDELLPWSPSSPPYRISADLTKFLNKPDVTHQRIANGVKEVFEVVRREESENPEMRWLVMGDDDSIFVLENLIDVLSNYDHRKYYYIGARSEFVLSNFLFSFAQGFGGAGFALSFPLARLLAKEMDRCLLKYSYLVAADQTAMSCITDLGMSLTEHHGFHQIDLRGDISGLLSSHPNVPLISLHHFDMADPIFPAMDRYDSTRHLMKAAKADPQRMLQQTVCYYHKRNWTFSISWGYSAHIYERIMPRSLLQYPIETFRLWLPAPGPPFYMFNTRLPSPDPCEAPHIFYFQKIEKSDESNVTSTSYMRSAQRGMPACAFTGNHSADMISKVRVYSPSSIRKQVERSECCDVVGLTGNRAKIKYRECRENDALI